MANDRTKFPWSFRLPQSNVGYCPCRCCRICLWIKQYCRGTYKPHLRLPKTSPVASAGSFCYQSTQKGAYTVTLTDTVEFLCFILPIIRFPGVKDQHGLSLSQHLVLLSMNAVISEQIKIFLLPLLEQLI